MVVYHRLPLTPNPFTPRNDQKPNFPQQYPDNFKQKCNENINLEILFDSQMVLRSTIQIKLIYRGWCRKLSQSVGSMNEEE